MSAAPAPPRLPRALLRLAVPDEVRDAVDGDLHELHAARRAESGSAAAALWYWLEAPAIATRFALDRAVRAARGLVGGAAPSSLDLKLGARLLARSPGLALVGGLGMAAAIALGAGAYAAINTYFYPELPLHEGDRVVSVGKFDPRRDEKDSGCCTTSWSGGASCARSSTSAPSAPCSATSARRRGRGSRSRWPR